MRCRKFLTIAVLMLLLLLTVTAAGCSDGNPSAVRAAMAVQGKGEITIGLAWPIASNDGMLSKGVEMAVDELNSTGGINGRKIRIIRHDDEGSVTKGMAVAQSLADNPEVVAVIGHRNSFVTIPAASLYEKAGVVMLTPGSTAPELTTRGYRYIFRSIPSDVEIAKELAASARKTGHQKIAVYYSDDSYGRGLAGAFEQAAAAYGIDIVDRVTYYTDLADLARIAKRWKALDCDGVFVAQAASGGAEFMKDARKIGLTALFFGGNAMDSPTLPKLGGQAAEGTVVGTIFNPGDPRPEVQKFVRGFRETYGTEPVQYAAQGYDAVKVLAEAIKQGGSSEPAKIAAKLRGMKAWPGVSGLHSFDGNGEETGKLVILKVIKNGKLEVLP